MCTIFNIPYFMILIIFQLSVISTHISTRYCCLVYVEIYHVTHSKTISIQILVVVYHIKNILKGISRKEEMIKKNELAIIITEWMSRKRNMTQGIKRQSGENRDQRNSNSSYKRRRRLSTRVTLTVA